MSVNSSSIGLLRKTLKNVSSDCDVIVRSACCSKALLNENTGIFGCELTETECPFGEPNPNRCLAEQNRNSINACRCTRGRW